MIRKISHTIIGILLLITTGEAGAIGKLYGRFPNWEGSSIFNLRIKSFDVQVTIQDQLAITHIDETFANDNFNRLEGIYILELPEGAKLTEMYLWIDGVRLEQEIKPRDEAVQIFEEIVRRQTDPLLAEIIGENVFRFRLFPIDPLSERRIEITYIHLLPYQSGESKYLFPLDVSDFETDPIERGSISIHLKSQFAFISVATPSYPNPPANTITQISANEYQIAFGNEGFIPDRDYDLVFRVNRDRALKVLTFATLDEDDFYLLWGTPPDSIFSNTDQVKNLVFVADVSSSMEDERLQAQKDALIYFIQQLGPADRFNVVAFSTGVTQFQPDLVDATPENVQAAINFISGLSALGLTNLDAALQVALSHSFDLSARNSIVLFTDGMPNHGVTNSNQILNNIRTHNTLEVGIFPVGIGDDIDRSLLRAIASQNNGILFIESETSLSDDLPKIYQSATSVVLKQISLTYQPALTFDRYSDFNNLTLGSQLVETGRFFGSNNFDLNLSGTIENRTIEISESLVFPDTGSIRAVSQIWASKKIDFLLAQIAEFGEVDELVDAVVSLSVKYSVLSPYTAFLIIEPGEGSVVSVDEPGASAIPEAIALFQNYPNPFNPETTIRYHVARSKDCSSCLVRLEIYNLLGELVRVLVNETQEPGVYTVIWDGRDERSNLVPSGMYVYKLKVGDFVHTRRMTMLK